MQTDIFMVMLRNIILAHMLFLIATSGSMVIGQQELIKIWHKLKSPLMMIKSKKTNHKTNKFWEIDMTKFEP